MNDEQLLAAFVSSFESHDDMASSVPRLCPDVHALRLGKPGALGERWRPKRIHLTHRALDRFYQRVPVRLPELYETLITSYRWAEVEIGPCTLLANPPSEGLSGLIAEIFRDPGLTKVLLPAGLVPFARTSGGSYDPVCFDTHGPRYRSDAAVVRVDHEALLCHARIRVVAEIAPSFRALVQKSLETGAQAKARPGDLPCAGR